MKSATYQRIQQQEQSSSLLWLWVLLGIVGGLIVLTILGTTLATVIKVYDGDDPVNCTESIMRVLDVVQTGNNGNGNGNGNGNNNCPPPATPPVYPGCLPATCESRGSISVNGAFISTDGVSVLNSQGRCCQWDPRQSGQGQARAPLTVTLPMQTTDDLFVVTTDTLLNINVQLSGGDLAIRACLPAFTFTLSASTPDANGLLGLGGYFASNGSVWIPQNYAPASANYTALPLKFTPVAGRPPMFANFFNDGSVRLTGRNGVAIPSGTYNVLAACIVYNSRRNAAPPPLNVLISDPTCISTIAETEDVQDNAQTLFANFYEYFAMDYYNGVGYITGVENCYPASNNGSKWFDRSFLTSFYRVTRSGPGLTRLNYLQALDSSLSLDSVSVLGNQFVTRPTRVGVINTNNQEPGVAVSRLDPNKIAVAHATNNRPINEGGWQVGSSTNGGLTWDMQSVNLAAQVGIPGNNLELTYPQVFFNASWNCSNYSGSWKCPPLETDTTYVLGSQLIASNSIYPSSGGDNRLVVDAFDVFWQVGLYSQGVYPVGTADVEVTYSLDYGQTWYLAGDLTEANGTAYSYDFNVVAAGPDGRGGSQYCVAIKVDDNVNELIAYGTILPVEMNCFHTSTRGIVDAIDRVSIPGTNAGHYGGMAIGKDGTIYFVLQGMQPVVADPFTGGVIGVGAGPYGSNILANAPVIFTTCTPSPNVVCRAQSIVIARTDMGFVCPGVQSFRCTWSQPNVVVDKNNNLYVFVLESVRNPLPTQDAFFSFINQYQSTRILMFKSCDGGQTWAPPQSINDDATVMGDSFTTPNVHFNLLVRYDPITDTILASWMDTRVDPDESVGAQIYSAVITL